MGEELAEAMQEARRRLAELKDRAEALEGALAYAERVIAAEGAAPRT